MLTSFGFKTPLNTPANVSFYSNMFDYAYYTLFGLTCCCLYIILPFTYFKIEESKEDDPKPILAVSAMIGTLILLTVYGSLINTPNPAKLNFKWINDLMKQNELIKSINFLIGLTLSVGCFAHAIVSVK
jgi:hypothetical protein